MIRVNNQKVAGFLLIVASFMAMPAYLIANQTEVVTEQEVQVEQSEKAIDWCKQESVCKIASGALAAAVVSYAVAVYMNKVASPVELFNAMWFPKQTDMQTSNEQSNTQQENIIPGNVNTEQDVSGKNDEQCNPSEQNTSDDVAGNDIEDNTRPIDHLLSRFFEFAWEKYDAWKDGSKRLNENYPI